MSRHDPERVTFLWQWLDIATAKLSAPAKERIQLEIEAHVADSVQSHQAEGYSETDAQAAALAELGDATTAAKRFRRRHLTSKEAKRVGKILERSESFQTLAAYAFCAFACLLLYIRMKVNTPDASIMLMITVAYSLSFGYATIGFLAHRKSSKPDIRLLVLLKILSDGCFEVVTVKTMFGWLGWEVCCAVVIVLTMYLLRDFRIWFKLGQGDTIGLETPSRGAPAE